jgi:hypothetical protein
MHKKYDLLSHIVRKKVGTEKLISKTLITILYYKTPIWHKKIQNVIKIENLFLKIIRLREKIKKIQVFFVFDTIYNDRKYVLSLCKGICFLGCLTTSYASASYVVFDQTVGFLKKVVKYYLFSF